MGRKSTRSYIVTERSKIYKHFDCIIAALVAMAEIADGGSQLITDSTLTLIEAVEMTRNLLDEVLQKL